LTAAGFCVNVVKLVAASYLTALDGALSSSEMHLIHLAYKSASIIARSKTTHPVPALRLSFLAHQLDHRHLHQLVHAADLIKVVQQVSHRGRLRDLAQRDESVALARRVGFLLSATGVLGRSIRTAARNVSSSSGASGMRCSWSW